MKCLEKNPGARYPSAEALAEDLERWLRQEPIHARPAGLGLRTRRWISRNRLGTALIISLCAGLGAALVLLELTLARGRERATRIAAYRDSLTRDVEEVWQDSARPFVPIRAPQLAEMANLPPRATDPFATHLTFGLNINHEPLGQAMQYAPFLSALEHRLEKALKRPVLIDLRLYKSETNSIRDTAQGQLDLVRMGALPYVLAKQTMPGLEPVVRERTHKDAVIFAGKITGISNLAQVAGHLLRAPQDIVRNMYLYYRNFSPTNCLRAMALADRCLHFDRRCLVRRYAKANLESMKPPPWRKQLRCHDLLKSVGRYS